MILRWIIYVSVALAAGLVFSEFAGNAVSVHENVLPDSIALGREVYIAEGCIHCHSQFVRPVGRDAALWGMPTPVDTALSQEPVLIGNRRQGPDLANVALRRPREWNRLHLINPRSLMPGSRMPSYDYLFKKGDLRGPALLDYLDQLRSEGMGR